MPQICFHILLVGGGFSKKLLSREREKTIIWTNSFRSNQQNTFLKRHSTTPLSTDRNLTEFLYHIFNLNLGLEIDRGIVLEKITNFYLFFKTENQPVSNNSMRTLKLQRVELTLHSYKSLSLSFSLSLSLSLSSPLARKTQEKIDIPHSPFYYVCLSRNGCSLRNAKERERESMRGNEPSSAH